MLQIFFPKKKKKNRPLALQNVLQLNEGHYYKHQLWYWQLNNEILRNHVFPFENQHLHLLILKPSVYQNTNSYFFYAQSLWIRMIKNGYGKTSQMAQGWKNPLCQFRETEETQVQPLAGKIS